MRHFFRNAGMLAAAELIARLKGVLVLPILTRYLGASDFGVWSQVSVLVLVMSPLIALGTDNGLLRILPGQAADRQLRLFIGWAYFILAGACIAAVLLLVSGDWLSTLFFGNGDYRSYVPLAVASLFTTMLPNAGRLWFRLRNDGLILAVATVTQAALGIVAVLAAILLRADVYHIIIYSLAADFVLGATLIGVIVVRAGWVRADFSILPQALKFGLPLLPTAYAMLGLNWMDRLFLVQYQDLHEIGIYAAAYGLGYAVIQVFVNPIWALYPNSAAQLHNQGDHAGLDRLLHVISWSIMSLSVPAIVGLWALDDAVMSVVAGADYRSGARVMPVIGLAYLMSMLASFGEVALGLAYRQIYVTTSITLAVASNLVLNVLLIPPYGILGAAFATFGAFFVQFILSTVFASRSGPFWRDISIPLRIIVASILMGLLVRGLDSFVVMSDVTRLIVFIPFGAVAYAVFAVAFRAVPPSIFGAARAWLVLQKGPTI